MMKASDFAAIMFTWLFVAFYLLEIITWSLWWVLSPAIAWGVMQALGTVFGFLLVRRMRKKSKEQLKKHINTGSLSGF